MAETFKKLTQSDILSIAMFIFQQLDTKNLLKDTTYTLSKNSDTGKIELKDNSGVVISSVAASDISEADIKTLIESYGYQTATQVNSAITSKGYQTSSQVESIVEGYNYTTSSAVKTQIEAYGYQNASDVTSAINAKGYQTASQVQTIVNAAVTGSEHLKRTVVDALPPVASADANTIYLVANGSDGTNKMDEYMLINGAFEKIGDTAPDLTDYVKTSDMIAFTDDEIKAAVTSAATQVFGS